MKMVKKQNSLMEKVLLKHQNNTAKSTPGQQSVQLNLEIFPQEP